MLSKFENPSFENLVTEQESVQAEKFQGRLLSEYCEYIFPGQKWPEPCSSTVTDFLRPICIGERVSLEGVLEGLALAKGQPLHWADMGGGRGLAMRQLAANPENRQKFIMTNVDLFDYGVGDLQENELQHLENLAPGMTSVDATPHLVRADAETVALSEPADIITSVETIQYLNNPLAAISNWYDQLSSNGILIITAEHDWARDIRYSGINAYEDTPSAMLLEQLASAGVSYAATDSVDWANGTRPRMDPNGYRILAIQKKPGTQMIVNSGVVEQWTGPGNYKAAYYTKPISDKEIIKIV